MNPPPVLISKVDHLEIRVFPSNAACGSAAASHAYQIISDAISFRGTANIILATGNSQLTFLHAIRSLKTAWGHVNIFHMDEYLGLPAGHPASFPQFLREHLINFIQARTFFPISGTADANITCSEYSQLLKDFPPDLCVMGIGENGHIAFNDPPYADFSDPKLIKVVQLDQRSRQQQVGEGHFANLDEVPTHAITLTIPALLTAQKILCIVPEQRKSKAVKSALLGEIHPGCPASILRLQNHCSLYLDLDSSSEVYDDLKSRH